MRQPAFHSGQGHISLVRWQSLLCQGRMENQWNWPVQSSVPIIWPRSQAEKDLAQQSKQKTLKGPSGHFFSENYGASISHLKWGPSLSGKVWYYSKVHTSRSKIKIWQCVRPDQLYLLSGSSAWWLPPPRAAAQLAALLIRPRLKTLHVPWKSQAQSSDIDRATPRWVFLFLACVWELG